MKMNLKRKLAYAAAVLFLVCAGFLNSWSQTTLNPTADTDTQSDVPAGTNPSLNASQYNYMFMKFSLSSISGTITSAKLRVYTSPSAGTTLIVSNASPDSWTEGSTKPTLGTTITSVALATGASYKEVDVTSRVVAEAAGDDLITFGLTTNLGTWTGFNSRENASNKPQLVITTSGGDVTAPSIPSGLSSSAITGSSFTLSWNASTDNTAVTGYEIFRNGTSMGTSATTSFSVTGLAVATTYAMTVRARDAVPNWSVQSAALNVTTTGGGTPGKLTGTVIGTAGSWNNSGNTIARVFDNNTGTFYDAADVNANNAWAGLDLSTSFQITKVRYYPRSGNESRMNGGKFQGSNTANFTSGVVDLYTISSVPPLAWTDVTLSNATGFRYVRYLAPANSWGNVAEVEFYGPGAPPANSLSASSSSLTFASAAGSNTIAVSSNITWSVTDNQTWISASPTSGTNNGNVTITVTANTGAQRTGSVTITGGSLTQTVAITQSAAGGAPSGSPSIGSNFWRIDWGSGWQDYFNSGVNWTSTTNPWRADFVSDVTPYSVLRFMDWGPTNGSDFVNWSSRIQKTANQTNASVPLDNGANAGAGVAYEWQIDLCNRTANDIWINVPHKASDDFVRQLARLVRDNLTNNKKVYVEYSNEVWNFGFSQTNYADVQGQALGFVGNFPFKGKQVYINAWWGYYVYRACQVAKIFEEEFAAQPTRLVKVLSGQLGYDNWPDLVAQWGDIHPVVLQQMAALAQPAINPNNVHFDDYALAPYWNGDNLTSMQASIDYLVEKFNEARFTLDNNAPNTMKLVCYEAGQDGANQIANAQNAGIYNVYIDALNRIGAKLQGPLVHYTHVGWDGNYAWGAKQNTSSTLAASHKYRALIDWINAHPAPAAAIPGTTSLVFSPLEETPSAKGIQTYPNPVNAGILNVTIRSEANAKAAISILNTASQRMTGTEATLTKGNNTIGIPLPRMSAGLYYLVIQKGSEQIVKKVIVKK